MNKKLIRQIRRIRGVVLKDKKGQKGVVLNRHSVLWRYGDELWKHLEDMEWIGRYFTDDCHDYGKIIGFIFLTKEKENILKKIGGLK